MYIHAMLCQGCIEGKRGANEALVQLQKASEEIVPITHPDISINFSTAIKDIIVQLYVLPF